MADENEVVEGEGGEKKGGLNKIVLFAVIGLVVLGGAVGATLFLLGGDEEVVPEGEEVVAEGEAAIEKPEPAKYFPLNPPFVVNFESRGRQRYLQTSVTVMSRDAEVIGAVQLHLPLIRNQLVMLFSGQVYEELQTDEGRELLRQQALEEIQKILQQELGKPGIEQVLFTNFVMQ